MTARTAGFFAAALGALASCIVAASAPPPIADTKQAIEERLSRLNPDDPMAYFELAEEIAYESPDPQGLDLARRLFVLASELDRARNPQAPLAASACLALAELSTSADERRWLLAIARSLRERSDPASSAAGPEPPALDVASPAAALAEALDRWRAGDHRRAQGLLERPDVADLLNQHGSVLTGGAPGIMNEFRPTLACRECRNQRIVRSDHDPAHPMRLCYTCGGNPGPRLTDQILVEHLRLESMLLSGAQRSWAAQLVVDRGEPLRDADPGELAPWFNIDPRKSIWLNGEWVSPG